MKKVIAACIEKVLDFDTPEEAATYVKGLKKEFQIISRENADGKYRVRIKEQCNNSPMLNY